MGDENGTVFSRNYYVMFWDRQYLNLLKLVRG